MKIRKKKKRAKNKEKKLKCKVTENEMKIFKMRVVGNKIRKERKHYIREIVQSLKTIDFFFFKSDPFLVSHSLRVKNGVKMRIPVREQFCGPATLNHLSTTHHQYSVGRKKKREKKKKWIYT